MKVKQSLNVTQSDFFDYLTHSLKLDIFKNTQQLKNDEQMKKGLTYRKTFQPKNGKEVEAIIEITAYNPPSIYASCIQIGSNSHHVFYEITPKDNQIEVLYQENFTSTKKLHVLNYYFVSFFLYRLNKKKAKKMLKAMEGYILSKEEAS